MAWLAPAVYISVLACKSRPLGSSVPVNNNNKDSSCSSDQCVKSCSFQKGFGVSRIQSQARRVSVPWYPTSRPTPYPTRPEATHCLTSWLSKLYQLPLLLLLRLQLSPLLSLQMTEKTSIPSLSRPKPRASHHRAPPPTKPIPQNMQPAGHILINNRSRSTPPNKTQNVSKKKEKSCQWVSPFVPRSRAPQSETPKTKTKEQVAPRRSPAREIRPYPSSYSPHLPDAASTRPSPPSSADPRP